LDSIGKQEKEDCAHWVEIINALGGQVAQENSLMRWRVRLMSAILGSWGFLEWVIIAEDEAVEALAIQAGHIGNNEASLSWTRNANDERLHIGHVKEDILGMETAAMNGKYVKLNHLVANGLD
jgi:hypothetical protein